MKLGRILNVYTSRRKISLRKIVSTYGEIDVQNRTTFTSTFVFVPFSLQDDLFVEDSLYVQKRCPSYSVKTAIVLALKRT